MSVSENLLRITIGDSPWYSKAEMKSRQSHQKYTILKHLCSLKKSWPKDKQPYLISKMTHKFECRKWRKATKEYKKRKTKNLSHKILPQSSYDHILNYPWVQLMSVIVETKLDSCFTIISVVSYNDSKVIMFNQPSSFNYMIDRKSQGWKFLPKWLHSILRFVLTLSFMHQVTKFMFSAKNISRKATSGITNGSRLRVLRLAVNGFAR